MRSSFSRVFGFVTPKLRWPKTKSLYLPEIFQFVIVCWIFASKTQDDGILSAKRICIRSTEEDTGDKCDPKEDHILNS